MTNRVDTHDPQRIEFLAYRPRTEVGGDCRRRGTTHEEPCGDRRALTDNAHTARGSDK